MVGAVRFELTTSCTRNTRASQATLRPDKERQLACSKPRMQTDFRPISAPKKSPSQKKCAKTPAPAAPVKHRQHQDPRPQTRKTRPHPYQRRFPFHPRQRVKLARPNKRPNPRHDFGAFPPFNIGNPKLPKVRFLLSFSNFPNFSASPTLIFGRL